MEYDHLPVARQLHVELDAMRAQRDRIREGRERILRSECGAAAMGETQNGHWNQASGISEYRRGMGYMNSMTCRLLFLERPPGKCNVASP